MSIGGYLQLAHECPKCGEKKAWYYYNLKEGGDGASWKQFETCHACGYYEEEVKE